MSLFRWLLRSVIRTAAWLVHRVQKGFMQRAMYDTVEVALRGRVIEAPQPYSRLFRRGTRITALVDQLALFNLLARDPKVKHVIVRIGPLGAGWSQTQTLARALQRLKTAGIETTAFFEGGGNREYYLATQCDTIVAPPSTTVNLTGVVMEVAFFKELLDKVAVEPDMYAKGRYKSAVETFTRKGPTRPSRDNAEQLVEGMYTQLVQGIAAARDSEDQAVREWIDNGPYAAPEAADAGLIDQIAYYDELIASIKKSDPKPRRVRASRYFRAWRSLLHKQALVEDRGLLALVYVQGAIMEGDGDRRSTTATSRVLCRDLKRIAKNKRIEAVVLRVVSPGGSSYASDLIWRSVNELRQSKPVFVSMGDVAASGGYYVGMAGGEVLVEPGTVTGSIGVISGKFNLRGLYRKLGISKHQYKQGEHAGIFSDYDAFSAGEKERIQALMEWFYKLFVDKVAQSRGMPREKAEALAEGRVYLGAQALELGLADREGGLTEAMEAAKLKMKLDPDAPVRMAIYPRPINSWRRLLPAAMGARLPAPLDMLASELDELAGFDASPQYRLPFLFHLR